MDASKGIGLNTRFSTPSAPLGSTVQTSTTGTTGTAAKGKLSALDWKLKAAIVILILAFVAAATSRLIKSKKAKAVEGGKKAADEGSKEKESGKEKS